MFQALVSRHLAKSILLEESGSPLVTRLVALFGALVILLFVVWAAFARVDEVAVALGKVVPLGHVQKVQHLTGGTVAEILVDDGRRVEEGQPLVRLDTFALESELKEAKTRREVLLAQRERLTAFLEGRPLPALANTVLAANEARIFEEALASRDRDHAVYEEQIAQRKAELVELDHRKAALTKQRAATVEEMGMRSELVAKGLGSKVTVLALRRQLAEMEGELAQIPPKAARINAQIDEAKQQLAKLDGNAREKAVGDFAATDEELIKNQEQIKRLEDRIRLAEIRAPAAGIVHGLKVNAPGEVIKASDVIMEIVPQQRKMVAEVKILPKDIGQVRPGQNAMVRFIAYDFSRYGGVPGKLMDISATSFEEENNVTYYRGIVSLDQEHIGVDTALRVRAGMNVQADIQSGEKTILEYLLRPIQSSAQQALRER